MRAVEEERTGVVERAGRSFGVDVGCNPAICFVDRGEAGTYFVADVLQ